jgi:hypothetical protein
MARSDVLPSWGPIRVDPILEVSLVLRRGHEDPVVQHQFLRAVVQTVLVLARGPVPLRVVRIALSEVLHVALEVERRRTAHLLEVGQQYPALPEGLVNVRPVLSEALVVEPSVVRLPRQGSLVPGLPGKVRCRRRHDRIGVQGVRPLLEQDLNVLDSHVMPREHGRQWNGRWAGSISLWGRAYANSGAEPVLLRSG